MQTQQRPCVPASCHPNPNPQGSSDIRPSSSSWGLQSPPPPSSASQPQYDRWGLLNSRPLSLERGKRPCNSNVGTQAGPTLVFGLVVVAGLIGDAMLMGIGPHWKVIAAFTGASVATVDDVLHRKQGGGPRAFPLDVDAVCNSQHAGQHHPVVRSPATHATGLCPLLPLLCRPQLNCGFRDMLWSSSGTVTPVCVKCQEAGPDPKELQDGSKTTKTTSVRRLVSSYRPHGEGWHGHLQGKWQPREPNTNTWHSCVGPTH